MTPDIPDATAQRIAAAICAGDNAAEGLDTLLSRAAGCAALLCDMACNARLHGFPLLPDTVAAACESLTAELNAAQALFAHLRARIGQGGRAGA